MKRIFISFDYDHDKQYRYLLSALKENPRNDLEFDDLTPGEIGTSDIGRVKAVLARHIRDATHTLVVVGAYANTAHADQKEIGERNWQWWEVKRSIEEGNGLIGVKIKKEYESPTPLLNADATWAMSFTVDAIISAVDRA